MSENIQQWHDIAINKKDVDLDLAGVPKLVTNQNTIAQDITHYLLDSGVLLELIGERNPVQLESKKLTIQQMIEEDLRVKAGSVEIEIIEKGKINIKAHTISHTVPFNILLSSEGIIL